MVTGVELGENAYDSFLVFVILCTLSTSLHRSAPAQPPTEGTEGTAPGGGPPGPPPNMTSNRRLQQTQAQVEEVVDIMRVNVDKVLERDQKLSELDDRADALQAGASQFESSAAKLKRKYWWKNCKVNFLVLSPFFSCASTCRRQENSQLLHSLLLLVPGLCLAGFLGGKSEYLLLEMSYMY
ncbi:Hypothetical predicted protein [Marmota monax]|uniref:Vesicle-associated membrane protein 1 n=1 Tax=Marmota monax TaxID=9995 RepID=A0A5E4B5B2_MARMO|nr:vesicle-associated membrane protein 1 [Marmota monax]VTJ64555.1 Hypothetical predicted protein [Marmota monax]